MPQDPVSQLDLFRQAVDALGGQRATARYLGITERQVRFLVAGDRPLHDGFLRDVASALITHADLCRQLERRLSPAFVGNLTDRQRDRQGKPDARRYDNALDHLPAGRFKAALDADRQRRDPGDHDGGPE